MLTQLKKRRK